MSADDRRAGRLHVKPTCPECGTQLTPGGVALGCVPGGGGVTIPLPAYCADPQCRRDRDEAAIARAIAAGVIEP